MTISADRDALKTFLETISGLHVYDTVPESVNTPCAIIFPVSGNYDFNVPRTQQIRKFEILILVAYQGNIAASQDAIDPYLEPSGTGSIKATVEGKISPGFSRVLGWRDYTIRDAFNSKYFGVTFDIQIQ